MVQLLGPPETRKRHPPRQREAPCPESGVKVRGLGFRVEALGFGIQGSALEFVVWELGFRFQASLRRETRVSAPEL